MTQMSDMPIQVAIAINRRFLPAAAAMMASALHNRADDDALVFHVMHCELTDADQGRLSRMTELAPEHCRIVYHRIDMQAQQDFVITGHLSAETYFRLQIQDMLPELDRIIYLDVDIVVRTSLRELWQLDFQDNLIAAAGEHDLMAADYDQLQMPPGMRFGAGMMVYDLQAMRHEPMWDTYLHAMDRYRQIGDVSDQTLVNHVCAGRVRRLALRWNAGTIVYRKVVDFDGYDQADVIASITDPAIAHYYGRRKPWQFCRDIHPYAREYWQYLAMTPWKWQGFKGLLKRIVLRRKRTDTCTYAQLLKAGKVPNLD